MKKDNISYITNPELLNGLGDFYILIGTNLKRIRQEHGDTQNELCDKIFRSRGFISQIESNMKVGVSLDTLYRICKVYNIDIKEFFLNTENFFIKNDNKSDN